MAIVFKNLHKQMQQFDSVPDNVADPSYAFQATAGKQSIELKNLNPRQRKALQLFVTSNIITSRDIGNLFGCKPRRSAKICADWVAAGFLEIVDASNKARSYKLAEQYKIFIE